MAHVGTAAHESKVQLNYAAEGLSPYWALRQVVHQLDGGVSGVQLDVAGEQWDASLGYQQSGFAPRPSDEIETVHEYRFHLAGDGQRKVDFHVRPRWDDPRADGTGAYTTEGKTSPIPAELDEAVNVFVQGSNIELDAYPRLLSEGLAALAAAEGVDWNGEYFAGPPHEYSAVVAHERYVRVAREQSTKLTREDGPLWRLQHLLGDQQGTYMEVTIDNTEIVGYRHQVRLNRSAANELLPVAQRGKQLKHYHPKHVRSEDGAGPEDPLYHPKFGALYSKSLDDGRTVPWHERDELVHELEEVLVNVLGWAGLPTRPVETTYVGDRHFEVAASERDVGLYDDPTPAIEVSQEATVVRALADMTDSDLATLEELVADGGAVAPGELAGRTGYAASTIYRALDRLDAILELDGEGAQFVSEKLRQDVTEVLEAADRQAERTIEALADVANMNPRHVEQLGAAWQRWLNKWGAEFRERDHGRPLLVQIHTMVDRLRSTDRPHVGAVLAAGLEAWLQTGRDGRRFRRAVVQYESPGDGYERGYVDALLADYEGSRSAPAPRPE